MNDIKTYYEFLIILIVKISLSLKIEYEMLKECYALISWQTIIPLSTRNERRKCSSYRICFDIHRWLFFLYPIWTFWNFYICISKTSCTFDTLLSQYKDNWCAITILFSIVEMLVATLKVILKDISLLHVGDIQTIEIILRVY